MTMIERVGRAIYEKRNGAGCRPWSSLPATHRDPYRSDARAALEAARDPAECMMVAACHASNANMDESWRAAIDAALSEGQEP